VKTFTSAVLAFIAGFLLTAVGLSQTQFLWHAFQHGGF